MARDFAVGITIRAFDQASGTVRGVEASVGGLEGRLRSANAAYQQQFSQTAAAARSAGVVVGVAGATMAAGLKLSYDQAVSFESVMKDVEVQSQATAADMQGLTTIALSDDFEQLGLSGNQVADALRRIASEGLSVQQMKSSLKPITETAIALDYDAAETTKLMLNLMAQYKKEASDMPAIADAMALGLMRTSFQGSELAEAMKMAGVAGSLMGWTLEETIATVDRVAKTTGEASMAGRYFRAVMMELKSPSDQLAGSFESVGIGAAEIAEAIKDPITLIEMLTKAHERGMNFAQGFSNVSVAAAGALIGEAESVKAVEASLHQAGAAHEAATAKMETNAGQAAQVAAQFANIQRQVGEALLPTLRDLMSGLEPVMDVFSWLMDTPLGTPFVIATAGAAGLLVVTGPLLIAVGSVAQIWLAVSAAATRATVAQATTGPTAVAAAATIKTATTSAAVDWARVAVAAQVAAEAQAMAGLSGAASVGRLGSGVTALVPALGQVGAAGASNLRVIGEVADVSTGRIKFLGDGVQAIVPASGRAAGAVGGVATAAGGAAISAGMIALPLVMAAITAYGLKTALDDASDAAKELQSNLDKISPRYGGTKGLPKTPVTEEDKAVENAASARDKMVAQLEAIKDEQKAIAEINKAVVPIYGVNEEQLELAGGASEQQARNQRWRELEQERRQLLDALKASNDNLTRLRKQANDAGRAVPSQFAAGVESNTGAMTGAMRRATDEAGKYLPHSDAEKGAFSGLTAAGEAVPSTIAEGIRTNGDEISEALREAMAKAMQDMQGVVDGTAMPVPTAGAGKPGEDRRGSAEHAEAVARMVLEYKKRADAGFTSGGLAGFAGRGKQAMPEYPGPALMNLQPGEQWTRYATGPGSISRIGAGAAATKAAMAGQALVNAPDAGRMSISGQGSGDTTQVFNFNGPLNGEDGIRQVAREEIGRAARQASYAR